MNFRPLGRTDLRVSELCLGTMHFGWKTDERTSSAILDAFRTAGGNFVQAAASTAGKHGLDLLATAQAEKHVGAWWTRRRAPRDSIVLATRIVLRDGALSDRPLAACLKESCARSLRRLRTDHIDLLLFEWNPALPPVERLVDAMGSLVRDGMVRYTGASGFPAWRVMESVGYSGRNSLPRLDVMQHDFSLVCRRSFETELADLCQEARMAFLARSPLAGGFLVDGPPRWRAWTTAGREVWLRDRFMNPRSLSVRDILEEIALSHGTSIAQTALAWVLAHPTVTSAVIGVTSVEQLSGLMAATSAPLAERQLAMLENPAALTPSALLGVSRPAPRVAETIETAWAPPGAHRAPPHAVTLSHN